MQEAEPASEQTVATPMREVTVEMGDTQSSGADKFRSRRITRPRVCAHCGTRKEKNQYGRFCEGCNLFVCTMLCRRAVGDNCSCGVHADELDATAQIRAIDGGVVQPTPD
eukprot:1939254-Karenia_brevis.AAC.1